MTMVAGPAGHIGITLASAGMGSQVNAIDAVAAPPISAETTPPL